MSRNLRKRSSTKASLDTYDGATSPGSSSQSESDQEFDPAVPRAGKWTVKEEEFAKKLIVDFETGALTDCEEGSTLRAYLAKKLNCAPMRISKKFAGKCIGKHVFARKENITDSERKAAEELIAPSCKMPKLNKKRFESEEDDDAMSALTIDDSCSLEPIDLENQNQEEYMAKKRVMENAVAWKNFNNNPQYQSISWALTPNHYHAGLQPSACNLAQLDVENEQRMFYTVSSSEESFGQNEKDLQGEADEWRDVLAYFCGSNNNNAPPLH